MILTKQVAPVTHCAKNALKRKSCFHRFRQMVKVSASPTFCVVGKGVGGGIQ